HPKFTVDSRLRALLERYPGLAVGKSRVIGSRSNQTVVLILLENVGSPSRHTAHSESRREQVNRDAKRVVSGSRVEIHVGVQLLQLANCLFHAGRFLEQLVMTGPFAELFAHLF